MEVDLAKQASVGSLVDFQVYTMAVGKSLHSLVCIMCEVRDFALNAVHVSVVAFSEERKGWTLR